MKNLENMKTILLAVFFAALYGNASAQYTGPGAEIKFHTIKEVLDNAQKFDRKDTMVKLKGFVIEQIKEEDFWFQDATGKIRIEIDKKYMPDAPFNEKTELIITGEVDYDLLEGTEIEVEKKIEFVQPPVQENTGTN